MGFAFPALPYPPLPSLSRSSCSQQGRPLLSQPSGVRRGQAESGGIVLAAVYWARVLRVVLPDRTLCLSTFCHSFLTVNKYSSSSSSFLSCLSYFPPYSPPSLSPSRAHMTKSPAFGILCWPEASSSLAKEAYLYGKRGLLKLAYLRYA